LLSSNEDIQNAAGKVKSMDKEIEAIIAQEAGIGRLDDKDMTDDLIEAEEFESDAYTEADAREEMIELQNDTIDTLVNDSQDASTEGIDDGGWNHDG
jgi:transcription termination/antitermination protein NusA